MGSLKTFIKSVRNSKTIAAERAVIRKESAKIRSSFRDVHLDNDKRRKNIQKLIYLYILGEPTYFGQVECLKLLASPRFGDKRVGYMATMLILDESQDILTLLTNSLDLDLQNPNQFIVGLALCTLGNIASAELAKDLYPQVEKLLTSPQAYVKKKAILVASKLIEKDNVLTEVYLPYVTNLLNEKSHAILLSTSVLINTIYYYDETSHKELLKLLPKIMSHIKLLCNASYSPEYDIKGIPDPFLFVALLKNIRVILQNNPEAIGENSDLYESLNDLLTQVCAKFENSKYSGYSILYECVKTIFAINSDSSLKVLGINILSKFLVQKDNNIRYVALDTLLQVIEFEPLAVQRHRTTIVGCLRDGDMSIRRRALELTFGIINKQNIKILTKELLNYLRAEDDEELKLYITTQLSISLEKFNPNLEWSLLTLIAMLKIAGNYFDGSILSSILAMIMQCGDKAVVKNVLLELIKSCKNSLYDQYGLSLVTIWCLGEYSDLILNDTKEESIIELIDTVLTVANYSSEEQKVQIKIYVLTTCLKLSTKLRNQSLIEHLRQIIRNSTNDIELEIQTRSIEYLKIFGEPMSIKKGLLERMPAPTIKKHENLSLLDRSSNTPNNGGHTLLEPTAGSASKTGDLLLDLLGDDLPTANANGTGENDSQRDGKGKENAIDLLADIFGSSSLDAQGKNGGLNGTVKNGDQSEQEPSSVEGFTDGTIRIGFVEKEVGNGHAELQAVVKNVATSGTSINNISVSCAVPKHQKLQLSSISKTSLASSEFTILNIKINGNPGSKVKIRVRLSYLLNGVKIDRQFDFSNLTKSL